MYTEKKKLESRSLYMCTYLISKADSDSDMKYFGLSFKKKCKWVPPLLWENNCQGCIIQPLVSHWIPSHCTFSASYLCQLKSSNLSNVESWKVMQGQGQNRQTPATVPGNAHFIPCQFTANFLHKQALFCYTSWSPTTPTPNHFPLIFCLLWSSTYRQRPYQKITTRGKL